MHSNSCVSSNLSDVFPSIPLQDATPNGTVGGQLVNIGGLNPNHAADVNSSLKYLGLNLQSQIGNNLTNSNGFFNEDRSRTNLIINYLPQSYDQNDLQRLFERVGPIRQCKLIRDKNTGASLCYGFVDFISPQHAALAIQTYHGYETEQKRLRVAYASSGGRRFTAAHRIPPFGPNVVGGNTEVTNENIIGWEVFAIGIPLEWSEPDLLKLFSNFGNVILIRLLAPQLSESPPSHKPRLSSPVLNGASSDLSTESTDSGRLTTTASIIFEEKGSAEISVFRLNGYQAPDWTTPLRLRIIGSVTRETYGMFCLPSRQSPALISSRIPNGLNSGDPLTESEVLNNLLNRRTLASSNSSVHGRMPISVDVMSNLGTFMKAVDSGCGMGPLDVHPSSFGVPPRAIIRNKVNDSANPLLAHSGLSHGQTLELLDLMDSQSNVATTNASGMMNSADRFSGRELSIVNALSAHRSLEQENSKIDTALRNLTTQNSPWSFGQQRSVLSTLPEAVRGNDVLLTSNVKRLSIRSPLILSPMLSNAASQRGCQAQVWLKLENIQPTGSFKIRGIENVCRKVRQTDATPLPALEGTT
ncbi:unnamed protein product [Calicophoron daubneyi]|uniref:RRM domain-containing protein n=1 Tax=Calicophoron daubneyi TaxID=300641 RepID=A0AAV2TAG8_CALDB